MCRTTAIGELVWSLETGYYHSLKWHGIRGLSVDVYPGGEVQGPGDPSFQMTEYQRLQLVGRDSTQQKQHQSSHIAALALNSTPNTPIRRTAAPRHLSPCH
jgi:hypothetical protein